MNRQKLLSGLMLLSLLLTASLHAAEAVKLATLKKDQALGDFKVASLYSDPQGDIVGAKFWHTPTGAPIFLFQIETVPQAFLWIDTPADFSEANKGLPHSLEHLLVGKGTKGRYYHLLVDMRLGSMQAATYSDFVAYSFSSGAGMDAFFEDFHAALDALFHPDFSDIEAEREFYHFGVISDPTTNKSTLVEKGTVYNEMQSQQDRYTYYYEINKRLFGDHNPFTFESGGKPDDMRGVSPDDIRRFHAAHYQLSPTTGFIFVTDPAQDVSAFLDRVAKELRPLPSVPVLSLPQKQINIDTPKYPMHASEDTSPGIYPYPGKSENDPGDISFAWKPVKTASPAKLKLLQLFFEGFADGEQSLLYKSLVDSKTREFDSGATNVSFSIDLENSTYFPVTTVGISGVPGSRITAAQLEAIRGSVLRKMKEVSQYPNGSEKLKELNAVIASYATASRRAEAVWIKTSPKFGTTLESRWKDHLAYLEMDPHFVKSMSEDAVWQTVDEQLKSGRNIWADLIQAFHLLETPYATASAPSPQVLADLEKKKQERIQTKIQTLSEHYKTSNDQDALASFEKDELVKTNEIEKIQAMVSRPRFTDHPPMTFDEGIRYKQFTLGDVPAIVSFFDRPATTDVELSFDLNKVRRKYYMYLQILPDCLENLGLKQGDHVTPYSELLSRMQSEVYRFSVSRGANALSHRADLTISAAATTPEEFRKTLQLMQQIMQSNYLDSANIDRLRDIVDQRISSDDQYTQQAEADWIQNPQNAFRYQDNTLFLVLSSQFTQAHWDARLKWRLHPPVKAEDIAQLGDFAKSALPTFTGLSRNDLANKLEKLNATGLDGELAAYWKHSLSSFAETALPEGLGLLAQEVQEDLGIGPAKTIAEIKELQRLVLNRRALQLDLVMNPASLEELKPVLANFLKSIPEQPLPEASATQEQDQSAPILKKARKRYPALAEHYPYYVGFVNPDGVSGNAVFTADFPGYSQLDRKSLLQELSSDILSGSGPQSIFMKTWEAGLAYNNGLSGHQGSQTLSYYADRSPDLPALIGLVNSLATKLPEMESSSLIDYLLSREFSTGRPLESFSERGMALARDIRDGNTPDKIRRHSEALLKLRSDAELLPELMKAAPAAIAPVLLQDGLKEQQDAPRSIFFLIGPESTLSEAERRLKLPALIRLWPSDYWL